LTATPARRVVALVLLAVALVFGGVAQCSGGHRSFTTVTR
jgi:hypothetical protein